MTANQGPTGLPGSPRVGISPPPYTTGPIVTKVDPNSGRIAGGTAVTITGSNFRKNPDGSLPSILFGTTPATSVVVVSLTSITCLSPAVALPALVGVSVTCNGQTGTLANAFTYYSSKITDVSPGHGIFSGGTNVTITGFNFVAGSAVAFGGTPATGVTFVDEEHYICITPNHAAGFVDVTVTEPLGAVATLKGGFKFTLLTTGNDIRRVPGIVIRDVLNNQPNSATFRVDGRSAPPEIGEKVEVTDEQDGFRLLFRGTVVSVEQIFEELTDQLAWNITAVDFTFLLNKYRPVGKYLNTSVSGIVTDLIAKFAPGFTATKVQTNLARVTATFDGSMDFSTCLNQLAQAIGGGHWYIDYEQDTHFFHKISDDIIIPDLPQSILHLGPGTPMVVSEGAGIGSTFTFDVGFYLFRSTFVYDNGLESALSPFSNIVALQGTSKITFTNIPIGAAAGTHAVVARRIYYRMYGPGVFTDLDKFVQINDNVTTGFTTNYKAAGSTVATVVEIADTESVPVASYVAPPTGSGAGPNAALGSATMYIPQYPPLIGLHETTTFTPGSWAFKVSMIYRDGTESLPSPASNVVVSDGLLSIFLSGIPIGDTINSVDVIGRKVYGASGTVTQKQKSFQQVLAELQASKNAGTLRANFGGIIGLDDASTLQGMSSLPSTYPAMAAVIGGGDLDALMTSQTIVGAPDWSPDKVRMWYLLNDNTTTSVDVGPGMGDGTPQTASGQFLDIPLWPNPDGPNLEDTTPPDVLDASNTTMLKDPAFSSSIDLSQVRNRIYVRGAGTSTIAAAIVGAREIYVAEMGGLSRNGGTVISGSQKILYRSLEAPSGPGRVKLSKPLTVAIDQGAPVNLFFQADDKGSQKVLAKMELDKNGKPTDGVHEYTIIDTALTTPFQLYMRAFAELEVFGRPITSIRYATRDSKTVSGKTVTVNLTNPPCAGTFLIQDVQIDQVHDESDSLSPRYTVTASSVKFDLSDLLLSLIANKIGDTGTGFAGVSTTSVVTSQGTDITAKRFDAAYQVESATPGYVRAFGAISKAVLGGGTDSYDSTEIPPVDSGKPNKAWTTMTTAAIASGVVISAGTILAAETANNFDLQIEVKTGKDISLGNMNGNGDAWAYWIGCGFSGNNPNNGPGGTNQPLFCFRYMPHYQNDRGVGVGGGADVGWTAVIQPSGVEHHQTSAYVAGIAADSYYLLRIKITGGPQLSAQVATFSVNGGNPLSITYAQTLDPGGSPDHNWAASQQMAVNVGVITYGTNNLRKLSWRKWSIVAD